MKNAIRILGGVLLLAAGLWSAGAQGPTAPQPALSIRRVTDQALQLIWTNTAAGFVLEQASYLTDFTLWQPVQQTPGLVSNQFSVTLDGSAGRAFYRLRLPAFTTIKETSPVNGETGLAVIRETIVRFTAPLSTNAALTTTNFYAGYGGRRLLSRIELSSDRTKATLFYLEPLPGSTRIHAVFDGAGLADFRDRPLDPDGDGVPGGQSVIAFDTLSLTPLAGTAVIGRVFASELMPGADTGTNAVNRPLEGVTITVDGREQDLRTTTDALGNFTLTPVPPGRFFVKIDGRTAKGSAYPDGAYYPYVGKAWEAVAGRMDNLAGGTGEVFLPLITAGTLQAVSLTSDTTISFPPAVLADNPALAGVSITVPANSLFSDDGNRGGKVGIAPVPPDRLPGPLPPGAQLPLVITVQTDGALNFDRPVPVCFPNLPNPTTGKPWPPGTQGSLISFNHKKGVWEDVGGMTVSADGRFFCCDPGVGILQPGWHGAQCPKPDKPKPPPEPDDCKPDPEALQKCFDQCRADGSKCVLIASLIFKETVLLCAGERITRGNKVGDACLKRASGNNKRRQAACLDAAWTCGKGCIACNGTPLPPRSVSHPSRSLETGSSEDRSRIALLGPTPEPIENQIAALLTIISDLLAPYVDSDADIPSQIVDQVDALLAQADQAAGGNAVQFLTAKVIELERANAGLEDDQAQSGQRAALPGHVRRRGSASERHADPAWANRTFRTIPAFRTSRWSIASGGIL